MGDVADLEGIANEAYESVGLDVDRPHVTRLARALLGPTAIQRGPRTRHGPAALIRVGEDWRIVICKSLTPTYALFAIAHELGHYLLRLHGCCGENEELDADYIGGALLAPRRAFITAYRAVGDDLPALASVFSTTETGAALRVGEVLRIPLAVVSPAMVRVRGPVEWIWPDETTLRRWAGGKPAPGVRKAKLSDDPRRVVLDARAAGIDTD